MKRERSLSCFMFEPKNSGETQRSYFGGGAGA